MYRILTVVGLLVGCSSDPTPHVDVEPDASTGGDGDAGNASDTSHADTDVSSTSNGTSGGSETSSDTNTTSAETDTSDTSSSMADDDGGLSDNLPDADVDSDGGFAQCDPLSEAECTEFGCTDYSLVDYSVARSEFSTCNEFVHESAYAGEGCGYLILKRAFGAGDTFMAFYDEASGEIAGWKFLGDTGSGSCGGDVPTECFEYGHAAPPNGVSLCSDAGAPPDADVPDAMVPDADVPDTDVADAEVPDAEVPDAAGEASVPVADAR